MQSKAHIIFMHPRRNKTKKIDYSALVNFYSVLLGLL